MASEQANGQGQCGFEDRSGETSSEPAATAKAKDLYTGWRSEWEELAELIRTNSRHLELIGGTATDFTTGVRVKPAVEYAQGKALPVPWLIPDQAYPANFFQGGVRDGAFTWQELALKRVLPSSDLRKVCEDLEAEECEQGILEFLEEPEGRCLCDAGRWVLDVVIEKLALQVAGKGSKTPAPAEKDFLNSLTGRVDWLHSHLSEPERRFFSDGGGALVVALCPEQVKFMSQLGEQEAKGVKWSEDSAEETVKQAKSVFSERSIASEEPETLLEFIELLAPLFFYYILYPSMRSRRSALEDTTTGGDNAVVLYRPSREVVSADANLVFALYFRVRSNVGPASLVQLFETSRQQLDALIKGSVESALAAKRSAKRPWLELFKEYRQSGKKDHDLKKYSRIPREEEDPAWTHDFEDMLTAPEPPSRAQAAAYKQLLKAIGCSDPEFTLAMEDLADSQGKVRWLGLLLAKVLLQRVQGKRSPLDVVMIAIGRKGTRVFVDEKEIGLSNRVDLVDLMQRKPNSWKQRLRNSEEHLFSVLHAMPQYSQGNPWRFEFLSLESDVRMKVVYQEETTREELNVKLLETGEGHYAQALGWLKKVGGILLKESFNNLLIVARPGYDGIIEEGIWVCLMPVGDSMVGGSGEVEQAQALVMNCKVGGRSKKRVRSKDGRG